jgi:hypothetical protein
LALKPGVWFRRGRLLIVSPDSLGTACPLSGRNSTYRLVQILEAGSKGTGDFNGDNKSDILWQNSDGTAAIWLMNGMNAVTVGAVGPFNPGPSWQVKGSGDFNGDGKSDILWQHDGGTPAMWFMDGMNFLSGGAAGSFNPGHDWHVIA